MPAPVTVIIEAKIDPQNLATLSAIWARTVDMVNAEEPGSFVYSWNVSADGSRLCIIEQYRDSKAIAIHGQNIAPFMEEMGSMITTERALLCGEPSERLVEALSARFPNTVVYREVAGLSRAAG